MSNFPQIIYLLLIGYAAISLNATFGGWIRELMGISIDLTPLLVVYMALTSDIFQMVSVCTVLGMMFDSLSANPIGISSIAYVCAGFAIYSYRHLVLRKLRQIQYISGALCGILIPLISFLILKAFGYEPFISFKIVLYIVISGFLSAFLTPVLIDFIDWVENTFNYKHLEMSSFRPDREIRRGP